LLFSLNLSQFQSKTARLSTTLDPGRKEESLQIPRAKEFPQKSPPLPNKRRGIKNNNNNIRLPERKKKKEKKRRGRYQSQRQNMFLGTDVPLEDW
jgi:hypothetical protein